MKDETTKITKWPKLWIVVTVIATLQNTIALFAVFSSSQDVLSDGACIGGVYGTLAIFSGRCRGSNLVDGLGREVLQESGLAP